MTAFLGFGTALPEHVVGPQEAREGLSALWPRLRTPELEPVTRHTVQPLMEALRPRSLGDRMRLYEEVAPQLARQAAERALESAAVDPAQIDLVVSVSCTGYMVPALDVRLSVELGLRPDVIRLPLTELGCGGGGSAIAAARRHLEARPQDRVLVVAVEVCSLTFQPDDLSLDNLTAALVFGDGAAAAVLGTSTAGLQVVSTATRLIPQSQGALGFVLRDGGFRVVLDRRLAAIIEKGLPAALTFAERVSFDFYAVHAGGPRVFDAVERALGLACGSLTTSRRVFRRIGNVSSASLLFVLAELPPDPGEGLALAFGPGVTVEAAHLRRCPE